MTVTTLNYTGAEQTFTVPAGATFVTIECWGAQGTAAGFAPDSALGGYSKGDLVVAPGTVLHVFVGGCPTTFSGGFNGGGAGDAGTVSTPGGGGTDVRVGSSAYSALVIAAGGGGGFGGWGGNTTGLGGHGGGASGQTGVRRGPTIPPGGAGGTQTSGYSMGVGQPANALGGGAGGGGFYGGFAGPPTMTNGGGGGGGSGHLDSGLFNASTLTGVNHGNGKVVITAGVNRAPLAPTLLAPPNNSYIIGSQANTFTWQVNDADPGDGQTRGDLRYKKFGDASWTVLNNAATTSPAYTLPSGTWTVGFQYEWQVSTYDSQAAQSPWSSSSFVNVVAAIPAPTITAPADGATEIATPVLVQWSLPGGYVEEAYQVQRVQNSDGTGTLYFDTGIVVGTGTALSIPLDASAGRTDYIRVRFRYFGNWSPWVSVSILNEFGPPHTPMAVCSFDADTASVTVQITNPAASGGFADTVTNDVYRTGVDGSTQRIATGVAVNGYTVDELPGAGDNDYQVVAYAANGASAASA